MKKSTKAIAILVVVSSFFVLSGCGFLAELFSALAAPTLYVYDARTGSGIANVVVTLTPIAVDEGTVQETVIAMSGSSGYVVFPEVEYGEYAVTAALSGYTFVPMDVTVGGWNQSLGKLYGVSSNQTGIDADAVAIFLTWGDATKDIDAHLTYPSDFNALGATARLTWADNAYYPFDEISRNHVSWVDKDGDGIADDANFDGVDEDTMTSQFAMLDTDAMAGPGPETISLYGGRTGTAIGGLVAVDAGTQFIGSILPAGNYFWMGAAEYYLEAFTTNSSLDDQDVKVIITQGTDIKGVFSLPRHLDMACISLFRVQLFYTQDMTGFKMVFMPDMRLYDNLLGYKGMTDFAMDSAFVVSGTR